VQRIVLVRASREPALTDPCGYGERVDEVVRRDVRSAAGGDPAARLAAAARLERAGRPREALAALDLPTIPGTAYPEGRALSERVWRALVASFERVALLAPRVRAFGQAAFDQGGRLVAWTGEGVRTAHAETGAPLGREPGDYARLHPAAGRIFYQHDRRDGVTAVDAEGARVTREAPDGHLVGVSPDGARVLLAFGVIRSMIDRWPSVRPPPAWFELRAWPAWTVVQRGECRREGVAVDRARRHVRVRGDDGLARAAVPLEGAPPRPAVEAAGLLFRLPNGLVASSAPGRLALHHLDGRVETIALDAGDEVGRVSLASDGRGLRVTTLRAGLRFELGPGGARRTHAVRRHTAGCGEWHPHADVWHDGVDLAGERVVALPRVEAWSPDGLAALCVPSDGRTAAVELWRAPA
jgi:hypothetical protein